MAIVFETNLPDCELYARGKVRDIYDAGDALVIVATDRLSAFDSVLPTPIPNKGRVLTALTLFWLDRLRSIVPNHLITTRVEEFPRCFRPHRELLEGRSMLVKKARMIPVECVARGYLAGSAWRDYVHSAAVCGIRLPGDMQESAKLPAPVFTPASKAQSGHDENIPLEAVTRLVGAQLAERLRTLTLKLYTRAAEYAEQRGILIADTKFEFGFVGDDLVLADEVLTPDSSRFWPKEGYGVGRGQPSYDKQFVRDYLEFIGWDKQPPAPGLPPEVVERTAEKYQEAYRLLTGRTL